MNRLRLSAAYVAIMLAGLLLFDGAAVFAMDRTQRSTLDSRLETSARAAEQFIDVPHGRIALDPSDLQQIVSVVGAGTDVAVVDRSGEVLFSSASRELPVMGVAYLTKPRFYDAGHGDGAVRVLAIPVFGKSASAGAILVWAESDWIDETDRNLAVALGTGAVVIALLALLAGNLVTRRALEDAFARQRRFTADASHELRAPLAVIRAEADLALRKERETATYRSALETIASEADHMEALIGDLLSAARAESGAVKREPVDASQLLERVAQRLAPAANAKGARIDVETALRAEVLADPHAMERALLAIGHNAVKYTPPDGVVTLRCAKSDHVVDLVVEDNGPGFSPEALEHGFERFWREPGSQAGTGSGLGLAIARSIVVAGGGSVILTNGPSGGRVLVRLPAA